MKFRVRSIKINQLFLMFEFFVKFVFKTLILSHKFSRLLLGELEVLLLSLGTRL